MNQYRVEYFYLATGMEGRPDIEDYPTVMADNEEEARYKSARFRHPTMSQNNLEWVIGCLTAKKV